MHNSIVRGGRPLYGAKLGILMLESKFPRIVGEMGNALTWDFPVHYKVVRGASPRAVVINSAQGLLQKFVEAGRELVLDGVDGITTNCGFLSIFQKELAQACGVPVATSALLQYNFIQSLLPPEKCVGVITISKETLTKKHLESSNIDSNTPIVGIPPSTEFHRVIINGEESLNIAKASRELIDAAKLLVAEHPEVGAILLECTNMSPYSNSINEAVGLPVYDIVTMTKWFYSGLKPKNFNLENKQGQGYLQ